MGPVSANSYPGCVLVRDQARPAKRARQEIDYGRRATWVPPTPQRVYAILDNLNSHRTTDVLLFLLAHPRWEMVFQPKYAAYLNLIEPWWMILRALALSYGGNWVMTV